MGIRQISNCRTFAFAEDSSSGLEFSNWRTVVLVGARSGGLDFSNCRISGFGQFFGGLPNGTDFEIGQAVVGSAEFFNQQFVTGRGLFRNISKSAIQCPKPLDQIPLALFLYGDD